MFEKRRSSRVFTRRIDDGAGILWRMSAKAAEHPPQRRSRRTQVCGYGRSQQEKSASPAAKEAITLRLGKFAGDAWDFDVLWAKKFEEENPGITVQVEDVVYGEMFKKALALAATGTVWDVFAGHGRWQPYLAFKGLCLQFDDFIAKHDIEKMTFTPCLADVKMWTDNKIYRLPTVLPRRGTRLSALTRIFWTRPSSMS